MAARTLIQKTGRAAFWNALMVPFLAVLGLAFSVIVRRKFGLYAGVYDTALGVVATLMMLTSVGIPTSLTKFLPEIHARSGAPAVVLFLKRVGVFRVVLAMLVLVPVNLFATPIAARLDLGAEGVPILRLASLLALARVLVDLWVRTLNAFFGQLRSNLLALLQGALDFALVGAALLVGFEVAGVLGMVAASAVVTAAVGLWMTTTMLGGLEADGRGSAFAPTDAAATRVAVVAERGRFVGYAAFTLLFELSLYFSDKAFANPALAVILGNEQVAVFTAGFNLAFMTVGLMVASFRGLYRPMFAHLRARDDLEQVRRAFHAVSKAQLVLLLPAGIGLWVLAGDYIPLLFGPQYAPAVPIARVFVVFLYAQTAFNLGLIWLSIDERYRAVLWSQSIMVISAPFFLIVAGTYGLVAAAMLFGAARMLASGAGYLICRRDYGFRFPWRFGAKVAVVAGAMGAGLMVARSFLERSPVVVVTLTVAGVLIYLTGLRVTRVLGPEETELLERSDIPGKSLALAWLAPGR